MRDTRFRGKTEGGQWVKGSLVLSKKGSPVIVQISDNTILDGRTNYWYINSPACRVRPETIGLYSGQLSKEEIEICEGDVLKFEDEQIGIVRWADGGLVVDADFGDYDTTVLGWAIDALGDCEIIGNIHDNPELLK